MAIVKVNWDEEKRSTLDNYIPLLAYALQKYPYETVSLEEFKKCFREYVDFSIPSSALLSIMRRASKKRYSLLEKQPEGHYKIVRKNLESQAQYMAVRQTEEKRYEKVKVAFVNYYKDNPNVEVKRDQVDQYFFETLYELAPTLIGSIPSLKNFSGKERRRNSYKYLVSKFIQHARQSDENSFDSIMSFAQGAMLTETFYYQQPEETGRLYGVKVFFDTPFIIKALGYCEEDEAEPRRELVDMLKDLHVGMRVFKHTYDEICRIFQAALTQLEKNRRLEAKIPGGVFDYFIKKRSSPSDVQLALNKLEDRLKGQKIKIEDPPPHKEQLTINEKALAKRLEEEFPSQHEAARNHDIDCLTSIYRLREGKNKQFISKCGSIFITSNARLSNLAISFFKEEYGRSDIPICMGDHVFTTLVWLRFTDKYPDVPKEQVVAQCYAAMEPSNELWGKYCKEAQRLAEQGDLTMDDYVILTNCLDARADLMDITLGEGDELVEGTIEQILNRVKERYAEDVINSKLNEAQAQHQSELNATREAINSQHKAAIKRTEQEAEMRTKLELKREIAKWFVLATLIVCIVCLDLWIAFHLPEKLLSWETLLLTVSATITVFGIKDWGVCKTKAQSIACFIFSNHENK